MPFPMTHLLIAREVAARTEGISDRTGFYLGNLAPDAVHFRPGYQSEYKKISHLCPGTESWGEVSDNEEWARRVVSAWRAGGFDAPDFMRGYCAHILADIYNNIALWMPFKRKYLWKPDMGYGNVYHAEGGKVDLELYQTSPYIEEIWNELGRAKCPGAGEWVSSAEVEAIRDNVLFRQYEGKDPVNSAGHEIVTTEGMRKFIEEAVGFVTRHLA